MKQEDFDHRMKEILGHLRALNARSAKIYSAVNVVAWLLALFFTAFLIANAERLYTSLSWWLKFR